MVKVLYISPNGYLGGAERFVLTASRAHLANDKVKAAILFFSDGEASKEARNAGVDCITLKNTFRFRHPLQLLRALFEIRRVVKEFNPDVLNLTMPYSHIVLKLATLGMDVKKVWFQHGPVGGKLDKIAKFIFADMIWYNCEYLKKVHHDTWPRFKIHSKEVIVNYGVSADKHSHQIFANEKFKLGSAGRICSWKGFHTIIKALAELKQETTIRNYSFTIAGSAKRKEDQEYAESLKKFVSEYHLDKNVFFLDHIEDMQSYYQSLDVFVHASTIPEPFGLVVAESMLNGCLVVASDQGGVVEMLDDGRNGIPFSATTDRAVSELKCILKKILCADENLLNEYRSIAVRGKEHIENAYSVKRMIEQIEELYSQFKSVEK